MKQILILTWLFFSQLTYAQSTHLSINQKTKEMTTDQKNIEALLLNYETVLNASDVDGVLKLYAKDGIFMPSNAPSAIGEEQIAASYTFVFNTIKLNIKFDINEIEVYGDVAFARTISKGEVTILENGTTNPEENRELFVLSKVNGDWKIARYMFNKMK